MTAATLAALRADADAATADGHGIITVALADFRAVLALAERAAELAVEVTGLRERAVEERRWTKELEASVETAQVETAQVEAAAERAGVVLDRWSSTGGTRARGRGPAPWEPARLVLVVAVILIVGGFLIGRSMT